MFLSLVFTLHTIKCKGQLIEGIQLYMYNGNFFLCMVTGISFCVISNASLNLLKFCLPPTPILYRQATI